VDGIGTQSRMRARGADGAQLVERRFDTSDVPDVPCMWPEPG